MAEVIGTITAALQLADTALKLKRLQDQIRNAPKDVLELVEEVNVLAGLLSDVRDLQNVGIGQVGSSNAWVKCYQLFGSAADTMSQLVSDLETTLQKHKTSGSFRVFLRGGELAKCKERLERLKSLLILAQQAYTVALFTQQNSSILQAIHTLIAQSPQETRNGAHHPSPHLPAITSPLTTSPGIVSHVRSHTHTKCQYNTTRNPGSTLTFRIGLPRWIVQKGLEVLYHHGASSWGLHIRTFNRVPIDSEVFLFALDGQWDQVQGLFATRRASPFDVSPIGTTLLHIAAQRVEPEACRMLLEHGLDPCQRGSNENLNVIEYLAECALTMSRKPSETKLAHVLSLLVEAIRESILTLEDDKAFYSCATLGLYAALPPAALQILTADQLQHEGITDLSRAQWAMMTHSPNPRTIQTILNDKMTLHEAFLLINEYDCEQNHLTLLRAASRNLAIDFAVGSGVSQVDVDGWKDIISQIVRFERTNTSKTYFAGSYMDFINDYCWAKARACIKTPTARNHAANWHEYFTCIGKMWLNVLVELGANLERYGRAEHEYITFHSCCVITGDFTRNSSQCYELRYLSCGPTVDDWKVFAVPTRLEIETFESFNGGNPLLCGDEEYAMAGDFWNWVENPELFLVPGTYLDRDDYEDNPVKRSIFDATSIKVTGPIL